MRYDARTLKVMWCDKNITEVLRLTVNVVCDSFADEASVMYALSMLYDIGLGYLWLGQSTTELSGDETQRIKLTIKLQRAQRPDTLYILNRPTIGLHPADVGRLVV